MLPPDVSAVTVTEAAVEVFYQTLGETIYLFVSFFVSFASVLAFGVVYNEARIALSERGRELATLQVLGFGRAEVSYILLGQVAFLALVGLPLGCVLGYLLAWGMTSSFETELFRVPLFVSRATYGLSVLIALFAAVVSAAVVLRSGARLTGRVEVIQPSLSSPPWDTRSRWIVNPTD